MKSEFRDLKLGDCCELITGFPFKSKNFLDKGDGKYKLARGINIKEGRFYWKDLEKTWDDINDDQQKYLLDEGDLLVSMDGSKVGKNWVEVSSLDLPSLLVQRVCCIRARNEISQKYIKYLISSSKFRRYIDSIKTGTSIPHISVKQLKDYPITIPGLLEQQRIANFLGALDKKIELNQKMNETLEEIAKTLFKSWFIDFDPVKAKAEGRPIRLSKEISDLFPDSFEESELGKIPKGWKVLNLESCIDVIGGHAFKSKDYIENGIFVLRTKNFTDGVVRFKDDDVFLSEKFLESHKSFKCEEFDYHLVMVGASIGKTGMIYPSILPALRNQNMWCFRPRESKYSRVFVKHTVDFVSKKLIGYASGSARDFFRKGDFRSNKLAIPSDEILISFSSLTDPILNKQAKNFKENETLKELRDTLLPKLISGELKIPDAENLIEEANV